MEVDSQGDRGTRSDEEPDRTNRTRSPISILKSPSTLMKELEIREYLSSSPIQDQPDLNRRTSVRNAERNSLISVGALPSQANVSSSSSVPERSREVRGSTSGPQRGDNLGGLEGGGGRKGKAADAHLTTSAGSLNSLGKGELFGTRTKQFIGLSLNGLVSQRCEKPDRFISYWILLFPFFFSTDNLSRYIFSAKN